MSEVLGCLVIGGGPAGLTASIYLGRFRRRVTIIDKGWSRAEWITLSHNLPVFPKGIAGPALLEDMRAQARLYGARLQRGIVEALRQTDDGRFAATVDGWDLSASAVLLATGVIENKPPVPHLADAVKRGRQVTPAAVWFLDNYYLIEEQVRTARLHLPRVDDLQASD